MCWTVHADQDGSIIILAEFLCLLDGDGDIALEFLNLAAIS